MNPLLILILLSTLFVTILVSMITIPLLDKNHRNIATFLKAIFVISLISIVIIVVVGTFTTPYCPCPQ